MSILIKGITKSDFENILTEARYGANNCMLGNGVEAIELPPHGRLIDADALETHECYDGEWEEVVYQDDIDAAPTIIEAEEGLDE